MYENLILFTQRLIRELELAKKELEELFQNKIDKKVLFKELKEILIRAKDLKSQFRKGSTKISHLNRLVRDVKSLRKYVKDAIKESVDKEHFEKVAQQINKIEEKIISIRNVALEAEKKNVPVKELVYA